jgi:hypothetical protein
MGIFLNTAAYGYNPIVGGAAFCTATSQTAGYTYYLVKSGVDASIPSWTVRVLNTITASMGGQAGTRFGTALYSCNAQYSTASFGGAQANSNVSLRSINGTTSASYGLAGFVYAYSSESCYTDTWNTLASSTPCSQLYSTIYGGTYSAAHIGFILRDYTKYNSTVNTYGNQPWLNTCATYNSNGANSHNYISCSNNTAYTSSANETVCARQYQQFAGTPSITNYYTGSCGTY